MDEIERQRLQALVDAVHLTSAAARTLWGADAAAQAFGRIRAGGMPPGTTWRPRPVPRGWLPISLGTERKMYVPYLSPFMSSVVPVYPGIGSPGLIHSGVGSGIPMPIGMTPGPVSYGSYMTPGIYGYRPVPYGVGLVHAGFEGSIPGGINPLFGINPMMSGIGGMVSGMGPMMHGVGPSMMSMGSMSGMPMQPAWSPMPMQPGSVPSV